MVRCSVFQVFDMPVCLSFIHPVFLVKKNLASFCLSVFHISVFIFLEFLSLCLFVILFLYLSTPVLFLFLFFCYLFLLLFVSSVICFFCFSFSSVHLSFVNTHFCQSSHLFQMDFCLSASLIDILQSLVLFNYLPSNNFDLYRFV